MSASDNLLSDRSREDIDHDDEVRTKVQVLRARMLDAFVGDKYREVVEELARLALDPRTPQRTRVVALQAYARAAGNLVAPAPQVTVNQGVQIDYRDLLKLVPGDSPGHTSTCGLVLPGASDPLPTPLGTGDHDHSLPQADICRTQPPSGAARFVH